LETADELGRVTAQRLDFESLFEAEYPRLMRMMYLLTGNREEARDVAEEAMVRVFERWDRVGLMDSPGGYAYRVALNLIESAPGAVSPPPSPTGRTSLRRWRPEAW
jgi:DNA-directed RNA polymerase specialized sigma24 family protein